MLISRVLKKTCLVQRSSSLSKTFTRLNHSETPTITNEDVIHRVDLRVGKIVHIENHSEANHLFIEQGERYLAYLSNVRVCVSLTPSLYSGFKY
jgi:hypothetical protein